MLVKKIVKPLTSSKKDQPCWIDKLLLMLSCYVIQYMIHAIVMVDISAVMVLCGQSREFAYVTTLLAEFTSEEEY